MEERKENLSFYYTKRFLTKKQLDFLYNFPIELSLKEITRKSSFIFVIVIPTIITNIYILQ